MVDSVLLLNPVVQGGGLSVSISLEMSPSSSRCSRVTNVRSITWPVIPLHARTKSLSKKIEFVRLDVTE